MSGPRVVVIGAGLGGLATSALLAKAGCEVTVLEKNNWPGGKSRRIDVAGQRIDTGPSLVTFPGVLERFFDRYDSLGPGRPAREIAGLSLERLPEVGRYFHRGEVTDIPVAPDHPWAGAWQAFQAEHAPLGPAITDLLTTDPFAPGVMSAAGKLLARYGRHLNTSSYLAHRADLPAELRDIIAIHTLNAGVSPDQTLALFATMPAVMAEEGVFVPRGGVYEIALALARLADEAGATIRLNESVVSVGPREVVTTEGHYHPDVVVSALDAGVLERLMGHKTPDPKNLSCSGVAVFSVLKKPFPDHHVTHSVVLPDDPADLFDGVLAGRTPRQTMAFVNYYRPGHIYPNTKPTAAFLLAVPAHGKAVGVSDPWVASELERCVDVMGLGGSWQEWVEDYTVLDPQYFAGFGATGGALYGAGRPWWQSGPFHTPPYRSLRRPWLWRVGASVHPGGGIPAVLGGSLIASARLLARYR